MTSVYENSMLWAFAVGLCGKKVQLVAKWGAISGKSVFDQP